jgi:hypothetical protein
MYVSSGGARAREIKGVRKRKEGGYTTKIRGGPSLSSDCTIYKVTSEYLRQLSVSCSIFVFMYLR